MKAVQLFIVDTSKNMYEWVSSLIFIIVVEVSIYDSNYSDNNNNQFVNLLK